MRSLAAPLLALVAVTSTMGCTPKPPSAAAPGREPRHVVLVTIDGVKWQDVFVTDGEGRWRLSPTRMPVTLAAVRDHGIALGGAPKEDKTCGTVHTFGGANLSMPGYEELLSARGTACRNNECDAITTPTLLDDAAAAGLGPVAAIGSWNVLNEAVTNHSQNVALSLGTHPWTGPPPREGSRFEQLLQEAEQAETSPGDFGSYRPDSLTSAIALEYFTTAWPRVVHVGLGDTDEYGHRSDRPAYLRSLREADDLIGDIVDAANERLVPLTVIVTTDHGRADNFHAHSSEYPESGRTFFLAFGDGIAKKGELCLGHDVTTIDVGATMRALIGLPPLEGPNVGHPIEAALTRTAAPTMVRRAVRPR